MAMVKRTKDAEKRTTGERIKFLREHILEMTQEEFANAFHGEFTRGALGNWERGEGIKLANLKRISQKFGVALEWLAAGVGAPPNRSDRPQPSIEDTDSYNKFVDPIVVTQQTAIESGLTKDARYRSKLPGAFPELDVQLGAGEGTMGEFFAMPGNMVGHRVTAEWLLSSSFVEQEARVSRTQSIILPVVGDSMFPNYCTGDRVIVDLSQRELLQDAVYVISDGQSAPQIKRLQRVFRSNPERVRIISDNPVYQNEEHLLNDVEIIGRVCGLIARR